MELSRLTVIAKLKLKFGNSFFVKTTEEFDGTENGLWISNESPLLYDQSMNYTDERLQSVLDECNWFVDPYDCGTLMLFRK